MFTVALRPTVRASWLTAAGVLVVMKLVAVFAFAISRTRTNASVPKSVELIRTWLPEVEAETPNASVKALIASTIDDAVEPDAKLNCCAPRVPAISNVTAPDPWLLSTPPAESAMTMRAVCADSVTLTVTWRNAPGVSEILTEFTVTSAKPLAAV